MFAPRRRSNGLDPVGWKALDKLRGVSIRGPGAGDTSAPGPADNAGAPIFAPDWHGMAARPDPTAFWAAEAPALSKTTALPAFREPALEAVLGPPAPAPAYAAPAAAHVTVARPAKARVRLGDIWTLSAPTEARLFALELAKVAVVMQQRRPAAAPGAWFALSGLRGMAVALSLLIAGLFAGNAVAVSSADIQSASASSAPDLPSLAAFVAALPLAAIGPFGPIGGADHRVEVCHRTGDGGARTITVDDHAVAAHLAHGDDRGACGPSGPGGNGTDPGAGGNGTDPGSGNETGPGSGGNETGPGPGGNETGPGPGGNETGPGPQGNATGNGTGGGGNGPLALILRSSGGGGGGGGPAGASAQAAAPAASAGNGGSGAGGGASGPASGHNSLLTAAFPMPGSLPSGAVGSFAALGNGMEAASGRRSHREGAPHGEDDDHADGDDAGEGEGEDAPAAGASDGPDGPPGP